MKDKKDDSKKELTDKQLAAKYDNGTPVNLDAALKKMAKAPSRTARNKQP